MSGAATYSESARLRAVDQERIDAATRRPAPPAAGAPSLLAQTTTVSTYPTVAATFFGCLPVTAMGTETEGTAGTLTTGSGVLYALNLGTAIPPSGTMLLVTFTDHRWVFRYDG